MGIYILVLFLIFVGFGKAYIYRGIVEDDEIFNDCKDQPDNVLNIKGLFNFSNFKYDLEKSGVTVEGNITAIWDIQPRDRIQSTFEIFKFDRGSWQPTLFSLNVRDFCTVMYDKNQYWYKFWTKNIANKVAIKNSCLYPGTILIHNKFMVDFYMEIPSSNFDGLFKLQIQFQAFNQKNKPRRTSLCFEIRAQSVRQ